MTKVYALYHNSRTMPLGLFDTEKLAFEALNHYAALGWNGGTMEDERRAFDVVKMFVHNKNTW